MRISDWSSDVCSSDLALRARQRGARDRERRTYRGRWRNAAAAHANGGQLQIIKGNAPAAPAGRRRPSRENKQIKRGRQMTRTMPIVSTAALATALLWSAPALAQDAPDTPAAPVPQTYADTEITVTGSRIQRDGFRAPTPLTVTNSEEIERYAPANR